MEFNQKSQIIWIPFRFTDTLMESLLMQSDISVWADISDQFKPPVIKISRRIKDWLIETTGSMKLLWIFEFLRSSQDPRVIRSDVLYRELAVHPTGKNLLNHLTFLSLGFFRSMDGRAPIDELVRLPLCFHTYFQFERPCTTSTVVQGSTVTSSASETPAVVLNLIKYKRNN